MLISVRSVMLLKLLDWLGLFVFYSINGFTVAFVMTLLKLIKTLNDPDDD